MVIEKVVGLAIMKACDWRLKRNMTHLSWIIRYLRSRKKLENHNCYPPVATTAADTAGVLAASSAALAPRPPVPRPVDFITAVLLQAARLIAR